ncbi:MAG TPA: hypothetical protein VFR86_16555 [Burkholderiaceae bacterium]|nr:hypothetical protein [Burkholderiaceae bacterium]
MRANYAAVDNVGDVGIVARMTRAFAGRAPENNAVARPPAAAVSAPRRGLLDRLDHLLWKRHQREVEAYLATSQNVFELEARIRDLDRAGLYPYY